MNYTVMYEYSVDKESGQYKAPFNRFKNEARVFTYKDTAVVPPNSDTAYSFVWLDLHRFCVTRDGVIMDCFEGNCGFVSQVCVMCPLLVFRQDCSLRSLASQSAFVVHFSGFFVSCRS